jgi:DNA-binding CsgD family transcriptional regulator/tetratricopeptide (TPR) repeat protein
MESGLLEREHDIVALDAAVARADKGEGSVVLVTGEAGIGKTSLIRSFVRAADGHARVLQGACDDLLTPRTLGPIRDAFGRTSAVVDAIAHGNRDEVLTSVLDELTAPGPPSVLVVEDVHWADGATLDVLRYVSRRISDTRAVLVVSYRDDEIDRDHEAQRLLGALGGPFVHRLQLGVLSRSAVASLAGGTTATSAHLYELTGGNPFYVSEVVAGGRQQDVPLTVVDAVLGRVHHLEAATQAALEQLAVVPSRVELRLARALLGDLTVLAPAERRGLLVVRPDSVGFRHELARRAVEDALPMSERMQLNARVLHELLGHDEVDVSRVVHHAVEAGDDAVVVEYAVRAASQSKQAGAYAQEITYYRHLLAREQLLDPKAAAMFRGALGIALFSVGSTVESIEQGRAAVRQLEQLDDPVALGDALTVLGPSLWALGYSDAALESSDRAVAVLRRAGETPNLAGALIFNALLRTAIGAHESALTVAREAVDLADRQNVPDNSALAHVACGRARLLTGDPNGLDEMRTGLEAARRCGNHVFAIMGYVLLVQDLYDLDRFAESRRYVDEGLAYAEECEVFFYVEHLHAYRARLQAMSGDWGSGIAGLRKLVGRRADGERGSLRYALSPLARLLARSGADDAPEMLAWARDYSARVNCYYDWLTTSLTEIETAWLNGRPSDAADAVARLETMTAGPGQVRERGELNRWKRRLGLPHDVPDGCPPWFAAGIRGDWRTAAEEWRRLDAPYQRALELVDSGDVAATFEAVQVFDDLGARRTAQHARQRLRDLGVNQIPRGPQPATRANPAGLTERQVEILRLVASGRTNVEIADELVVSVRTVDHHVAAVLQKLNVANRRHAAAAARELGLE